MDRRIDEMAGIPFEGSLDEKFHALGEVMFALGHLLRMELDMASAESEAAMVSLKGHPLLALVGAPDVRIKARRVAKRLKRMEDLADGFAAEGRKFHHAYVKHFVNNARRSR